MSTSVPLGNWATGGLSERTPGWARTLSSEAVTTPRLVGCGSGSGSGSSINRTQPLCTQRSAPMRYQTAPATVASSKMSTSVPLGN